MKTREGSERSAASENATKTLHWLLKSVNELRSELDQINLNQNFSGSLHQSEDVKKQMALVQVDFYAVFSASHS